MGILSLVGVVARILFIQTLKYATAYTLQTFNYALLVFATLITFCSSKLQRRRVRDFLRRKSGRFDQNGSGSFAVRPPSTTNTCPVMKADDSQARKTTVPPTSAGNPVRPTG
jgi:hypothetical protein